jgi:alpha-glucoside transport system permease protein
MNKERINKLLNQIPTHVILLLTMAIWIVPTLGLLITSLRPPQAVGSSGWWTVFSPQSTGATGPYATYCAECHGADGKALPQADLSNPELIAKYPRSLQLLALLRKDINGQPHMGDIPLPSAQEAADIATYLREGEVTGSGLTFNNYIDALVGYRGTGTYTEA